MRAISIGDYRRKLSVWGISFLVFGIICIWFGVGMYPDSDTYIQMLPKREPLYPLFLRICGNPFVAIIGQNFLAACSVAYFTCTLQDFFLCGLKKPWRIISNLIIWGCALMPHVMTPLGSASHMIISNSILTEGLTYPLYLLFSVELLKGLLATKKKQKVAAFIRALCYSFLLLLLRNQMMTTIIIWAIVASYAAWKQNEMWTRKLIAFVEILVAVVLVFLLKSGCYHVYYDYYCDGYSGEKLGNVGFLANALYLVDEEKEIVLDDSGLQNAYQQMLQLRDEKHLNKEELSGTIERALQYEDCYDPLKYEVIEPILEERLYADGVTGHEVNEQLYGQCGILFRAILPMVATDYVRLFFDNFCLGLIRTVSLPRGIFIAFGILIYAVLIGLLLWKQMRKRSLAVRLLLLLSLGMTLLHVAATAAVIMCLSRYVIYNTTFLYSAGFLALVEEIPILWERKKHGI